VSPDLRIVDIVARRSFESLDDGRTKLPQWGMFRMEPV
jgi:hypothetical protein